jgi:hypothetical protein
MNNRQAGRRRGRGGQRSQGNPNRGPDNGNRIDNRARGNAAQLLEKYKNLARDAQLSGDRVNTEYYLQFADHYFRVLSENRARFEDNRRPANDMDDDDGDGEMEMDGNERDERPAYHQQDRGDRGDRQERAERQDRGERSDRAERAERRPRVNGNVSEAPAYAAEPQAMAQPEPASEDGYAEEAPAPRRRGRPRRDAAPVAAAEDVAIEADRLPPSLGFGDEPAEAVAEEAPRRRRRTRVAAEPDVVTPSA